VEAASSPEDFAKAALRLLEGGEAPGLDSRRKRFAEMHSWAARAEALLAALDRGEGVTMPTGAHDAR
jgi:hypothetical protein